jgi:hypothetical protein
MLIDCPCVLRAQSGVGLAAERSNVDWDWDVGLFMEQIESQGSVIWRLLRESLQSGQQ